MLGPHVAATPGVVHPLLSGAASCSGTDAPASQGPWHGFAAVAATVVRDLQQREGLELWMVTHVDGDRQMVVASAGPWASEVPAGTALAWPSSFCAHMVSRTGPVVEPDVRASPLFGPLATGPAQRVRAYVGAPLLSARGDLFGSLCAMSGSVHGSGLTRLLPHLQVVAQSLSTLLATERRALERSEDAARAYALAQRDRLTGLRNRRGWDAAVQAEEQRARRYGHALSVVVVDLDGLKRVNDTYGHLVGDEALLECAAVVTGTCRPSDVVARLGGDEFGVLAVECDATSAEALVGRLRRRLADAEVAASVGCATVAPQETAVQTWHRADLAMYREKARRRAA